MRFTKWTNAATCPSLAPDEVHIWWLALDLPENEIYRCRSTLHQMELKRANRFRFDKHRHRYIAGRAHLRSLLGRYLSVLPEDIALKFGPLGKPYISDKFAWPKLYFNYSDSNGMALYAFSLGRELGIDLEHLLRRVDHDRIARRKFSASEAATIRQCTDSRRGSAFLACWTRKEAYGKAEGFGIRYPLDSVDLCNDLTNNSLRIPKADGADDSFWTVKQLHPHPEYVGAVAVDGQGWHISAWR